MFIITDGMIAPSAKMRITTAAEPTNPDAAAAQCDTCGRETPSLEARLQQLDLQATAASSGVRDCAVGRQELAVLLDECSLPYLLTQLRDDVTLSSCFAALDEGRLALLSYLKAVGVARLPERQTLANALGRRRKAAAS